MPEKNKTQGRKPSHKWATIQEVADHFCVGRETVRAGRGVFARLRRVPLTDGRTVILRADMERLDRELERAAQPLTGEVTRIDDHRKTA